MALVTRSSLGQQAVQPPASFAMRSGLSGGWAVGAVDVGVQEGVPQCLGAESSH